MAFTSKRHSSHPPPKDPTTVRLVLLPVSFLMRMYSIYQPNLIGLRMSFHLAAVFDAIQKTMKGIVALSLLTPVAESVNTVGTFIIIAMNVSTRLVIYLLIIYPKTHLLITNAWIALHPCKTNLIVTLALVTAMIVASYIFHTVLAMLINICLAHHQDSLPQPDLGLAHHQDHLPHTDSGLHHLHNQRQKIIIHILHLTNNIKISKQIVYHTIFT